VIRACAYVRVSTAKQAKEGLSLDEQQRAAEAHIEAQGWEHAGTFIEAGVSGRRDDRPQLAKVLESSNGLDVLVIPKLDRLGRSTRHLLGTVERLEANGVRLVSLKDHLDTSTPSGRLLLRVLASVAEFESDMIGERVASVTAARAEQGKAHGRPRYGYRSGEDGWELVPALAQVVVRVFTEYAEDGLSQREIARRLNGEGQRRPDGGPWTQTNVGKVLASPVYVGRVRVNGQTYDGAHEAIISEELWEKAEALRTAHARTRKGKTPTAEHILSGGMLRCGQCGGSMGAETRRYRNGRVAGTYTCSTRAHHGLDACPQTPVKQQLIDEAVFTFVTETAFDLDATRRELIGRAGRELADEKTFSHGCRSFVVCR
jgi:site-specific DNA recombinase